VIVDDPCTPVPGHPTDPFNGIRYVGATRSRAQNTRAPPTTPFRATRWADDAR
jgi:hypothetical protein